MINEYNILTDKLTIKIIKGTDKTLYKHECKDNDEKGEQIKECLTITNELNQLYNKKRELEHRIDELEDDNTRYSLGTGKPVLENPQFKVTGCPTEILDTSNNHYYW